MRPVSKAAALKNDLRESAAERATILERTTTNQDRLLRLQRGEDERRTGYERRFHQRRATKLR